MIVVPTPAGDMRFRVQLVQRAGTTPNELGDVLTAPAVLGTVWAKVSPVKSSEINANAENTLNITHEVRIRFNTALTHADYLTFGGRVLEIVDITDVGNQGVELAITCQEQQL